MITPSLLLLARLGLRASEVIALELDDIDWRAGVLKVRGKGRSSRPASASCRCRRSPGHLPPPPSPALHDTTPLHPEPGPLIGVSPTPVPSARLSAAPCEEPGCSPTHKGAHVLRHSLATGMLRSRGVPGRDRRGPPPPRGEHHGDLRESRYPGASVRSHCRGPRREVER